MGRKRTLSDVLNIMKKYRVDVQTRNDLQREYINWLTSEGMVAKYGDDVSEIKSAGGGHSDITFRHVERRAQQDSGISYLEERTRYLEHRWHRIEKDNHAVVFSLRIQGYSSQEIAVITDYSKQHVHRILKACAIQIIGDGM